LKKIARSKSKKSTKVRAKVVSGRTDAALPVVQTASIRSSGADKGAGAKQNPDLFPFDSKSLAQLAVGSSVVIATLLSVPDGVALIPGAQSVISWTLRLIGNWVIGAVLWFVGFSALVQLLRIVSKGIIATPAGLKLSRFDRLIDWQDIQAISLEPNAFFTRLFSLKVPARKLTIFFRLTAKNKILSKVLFPNFVPSFFFSKETFDSLVKTIFEKSQILPPSKLPQSLEHDYAIFAFRREQLGTVRRTSRWMDRQRIIVTLVIAISLTVFLGRKAAVNFCYNSGLKAYREGRLTKAREYYDLSTKVDPTFAAGWNALGQCEFHLAETNVTDFERARKDWKVALLCKPDYVEPKLNLARLALYQRKFGEAAEHIEHATFFDPQNTLAMLEKSELDIRRGRPVDGLKQARLVVSQSEGLGKKTLSAAEFGFLAHCLIAQARLEMLDCAGAALELKSFSNDPADYRDGQNITYMYLVKSRILAAQKQYKEAERLAIAAVRRQPRNEEALAQAAQIEVDLGNYALAEQYLGDARALLIADPWLSIIYGRQLLKENRPSEAAVAYADALVVQDGNQDAIALATVSRELMTIVAQIQNQGIGADPINLTQHAADAQRRAQGINDQILKYF
jgi:tetratricopeptide (TPR) repeat protein